MEIEILSHKEKGIQPLDCPVGSNMSHLCHYKGFLTPGGSQKGPIK